MKTTDWREVSLATGLAALTSHVPPAPTRTAIMKCGLMHLSLSDSGGVTLLPGLCSPAKAYLLPAASRRPGRSEPQAWLSCCSHRWTCGELHCQPAPYLAGNGRVLLLSREVRLKPLARTYRITQLKGSFASPMTSLSPYPSWDDISLSPCQTARFATAKCISNRVLSG